MAFNPFHRFRKHQRVILAVVTIMLMLVFGLTWGMGDVTSMFGGQSTKTGPLITTFKYPTSTFSTQTKVWERDVSLEKRQRIWANEFILYAVGTATFDAMEKLNPTKNPAQADLAKPKYPPVLGDYILRRQHRLQTRAMLRNNPEFAQILGPLPPAEKRIQEISTDMRSVASLRQSPGALDREKSANTDDLGTACDTLLAALGVELWETEQELVHQEKGAKYAVPYYLGGTQSLDDTLDFMLWKHQADRLGITYTEADVRKGVNRIIGVGDTIPATNNFQDTPLVSQFLKGSSRSKNQEGVTDQDVKDLIAALADEFRVQTAQQALLGVQSSSPGAFFVTSGIHQPPVSVTPDEFLVYVRDKRTTLKVALLTVPAKNFLNADEAVSEDRLISLYDQYRNVEPAPDRSTPAFKIPRKVRVEYVSGDPESPFYKDVAKKNLALAPQMLRFGGLPLACPAGGIGWIGVVGAPWIVDSLDAEYENYREQKQREVDQRHAVSPAVYDRHYHAAATVGDVLGSLQQTGCFAVPLTILASKVDYETVAAHAAAAWLAVATQPSPLTLGSLTIYPSLNSIQPRKLVEAMLKERLEKVAAERQLGENLAGIYKEFVKPGMTPEKAKEYLEKTAGEVNLQINSMTAAKDRYGLNDDPSLKQFKDDYPRWLKERMRQLPPNGMPDFADFLLANRGTYHPDVWYMMPPKGLQIYWLAEDSPAHELPYDEARPKVLEAARLIDARTKALAYVKELADKELKDRTWPESADTRAKEVKSFLEAKKQGRVFDLDKVSRLWTPESLPNFGGTERVYYGYSPPEADYPYPPANLVERLMALQKPGDATYLKDRPEKNFYVAVLLERSPPTLEDFKKVYENADAFMQRDPLWDNFVRERRQEFQKQFIQRLREEATGELDDKGRIKVAPDARARDDKSDNG